MSSLRVFISAFFKSRTGSFYYFLAINYILFWGFWLELGVILWGCWGQLLAVRIIDECGYLI